MSDTDDHRWDLAESDEGNLPESDEAFEKKIEEWQGRKVLNSTEPHTHLVAYLIEK